jgi:hypothetical protein
MATVDSGVASVPMKDSPSASAHGAKSKPTTMSDATAAARSKNVATNFIPSRRSSKRVIYQRESGGVNGRAAIKM